MSTIRSVIDVVLMVSKLWRTARIKRWEGQKSHGTFKENAGTRTFQPRVITTTDRTLFSTSINRQVYRLSH
jgi:hypothetical protein